MFRQKQVWSGGKKWKQRSPQLEYGKCASSREAIKILEGETTTDKRGEERIPGKGCGHSGGPRGSRVGGKFPLGRFRRETKKYWPRKWNKETGTTGRYSGLTGGRPPQVKTPCFALGLSGTSVAEANQRAIFPVKRSTAQHSRTADRGVTSTEKEGTAARCAIDLVVWRWMVRGKLRKKPRRNEDLGRHRLAENCIKA